MRTQQDGDTCRRQNRTKTRELNSPTGRTHRSMLQMKKHIAIPVSAALLTPLAYRYLLPASTRANICPLLVCYRELFACIQEPQCLVVTECIKGCDDVHGDLRRESREKFAHVQHPDNPNLCKYGCFDLITEDTAERFIECVGGSG